jgi:hypothetical protein
MSTLSVVVGLAGFLVDVCLLLAILDWKRKDLERP